MTWYGWEFDPPPRAHAYNLIVTDFPWPHVHWGHEATKNARPYDVKTIEEIKATPVGELAMKDCLLLHWVVATQVPEGIECMQAWGFRYCSYIHWRKVSVNGLTLMGQGKRVRTMGELCLVGTIGKPRHKPFKGDMPGIRREHSRKPESFYDQIDRCCPDLTHRADLFGRQSRPGWEVFGNQRTLFDRSA